MIQNILIILPYGDLNVSDKRKRQRSMVYNRLHDLIIKCNDPTKHYFLFSPEQVYPAKYFNKGQLTNIAIDFFVKNICKPTSVILHDIDILPDEVMFNEYSSTHDSYSLIPYTSAVYKRVYNYKLFAGSAVYQTTLERFMDANGFPNDMWGWGGEDDILHLRYNRLEIETEYNTRGEFESIDVHRESPQEKMRYLNRTNLRNRNVKNLKKVDVVNWRENGYGQINNYKIVYKWKRDGALYTDIVIKVELNTDGLLETIKHNTI